MKQANLALAVSAMLLSACGGGSDAAPVATTTTTAVAVTTTAAATTTTKATTTTTAAGATTTVASTTTTTVVAAGITGGIFDETGNGFHNFTTILENGEYFAQENIVSGQWHGIIHGKYTGNDAAFTNAAEVIYDGYLNGGTGQRQDGGYGHGSYDGTTLHRTQNVSAAEVYQFVGTRMKYSSTDAKTLYDNPVPLASLAGTYSGNLTSVQVKVGGAYPNKASGYNFAGLTIAADGTFSVAFPGCTYSGTLTPHGSKGVFDLTVTLPAGCDSAGTMHGIVTPLAFNSSTKGATLLFQMLSADEQKSVYMNVLKP